MKRITILLMSLTLAIIQMAAQNTSIKGIITLSHHGKEASFAYNEMVKAIDAAENGDTIYLSAGDFEGNFIINKVIAFVGVGADYYKGISNCTRYTGQVSIELPENSKYNVRMFDGIYFNNQSYITINKSIDNLVIRKCEWFSNLFNFNADITYMLIDRSNCYLSSWDNYDNLKKFVVRNSIISGVPYIRENAANRAFFYNCNISAVSYSGDNSARLLGTFYNCIIDPHNYYITDLSNVNAVTILNNCLYATAKETTDQGCTVKDCYKYTSSSKEVLSLTKEELLKNNYLGSDGTVVGCYGGKNPYTLDYISSTITKQVHLDKNKKEIVFNIKITE